MLDVHSNRLLKQKIFTKITLVCLSVDQKPTCKPFGCFWNSACKSSWFGCQWVNKLSHLICLLTHWPELWVTRNYSVTIVVCMVSLKKTGCLHVPVVTNKYTWVTFDCLFSSLWSQMNPESESVPSAKL